MSTKEPARSLDVDYRTGQVPGWVREVIETQLAIESEDAKSAGSLGFMARALVLATMPYKDPKTDVFMRRNGDFRLRIVAGYDGGIPYGIYPRLLMSWVATEAVRRQSPVLELGDSLRGFLREVMDIRSASGGSRGAHTRVSEQMKRLFGSLVSAQYTGSRAPTFTLRNVLIAQELHLDERDGGLFDEPDEPGRLWTPQNAGDVGRWRSRLLLSDGFFQECITHPVPIDLRAYKALRGSPLAMDAYTWLSYRMSYTHRRTQPIRWESLMMQFGSNYNPANFEQSKRDFKKNFLRALKLVQIVYPEANVLTDESGLVLLPSRTHVPKVGNLPRQSQATHFER